MSTLPDVSSFALSPGDFVSLLGRPDTPRVFDLRRAPRFEASAHLLPTAQYLSPEALDELIQTEPPQRAVVYCVYGHEVGQHGAAALRAAGWDARYLEGGLEGGEPGVDAPEQMTGWAQAALPRVTKRPDWGVDGLAPSRWITRERPKIDRIACPWLIRRFIDRRAHFFYAPAPEVLDRAAREGAVAFDLPGAPVSHVGERCSFDALLDAFGLHWPALDRLADTVRGADTDRLALAPAAAGLLAVSLGMSRLHADDDHAMLEAMMPVYDALYAECSERVAGRVETHRWTPA